MNLARAFSEIEAGADLFCLHKNPLVADRRGPLLDAGAFVAGLEYATGVEATVLGKPSAAYFAAALAALDAEPELTWMVTDDLDQDVRGAQLFGMSTLLVRTGKFRPEQLERSRDVPDAVLSSIAHFPTGSTARCDARRRRPDRDRARAPLARPLRGLPRALLHARPSGRTATRARTRPRATRAASPARRRSARRSASASRALRLEGHRDRRPAEARPCASPAASPPGPSASARARSTSR